MGKNGAKAKNQLIDFIGLSKSHFCQKWLKIQIGEGIAQSCDVVKVPRALLERLTDAVCYAA